MDVLHGVERGRKVLHKVPVMVGNSHPLTPGDLGNFADRKHWVRSNEVLLHPSTNQPRSWRVLEMANGSRRESVTEPAGHGLSRLMLHGILRDVWIYDDDT